VAQRVVIDSGWAGLNPEMPFHSHIVIEKDGSRYRLTGGHNKSHFGKALPEQAFPAQTIAPTRVAELVEAMRAPAQSRIDLYLLEPAVDDVQRKIDGILKEAKLPTSSEGLGAQVLSWRNSMRNPDVLSEVLTKGFGAAHTDDYPYIDIEVTLRDGTKLSARSGSQQYLLLPWKNARGEPTYSASVARALDALLPKGATNKERLESALDSTGLDELLNDGVSEQIGRFQAESEAPDAVRMLDANFNVVSVSFISWEGRHLDVDLRLPESPSNLLLSTRLLLNGKTLANKEDLLRIRRELQLAQSSPGLDAHMTATPGAQFRIPDSGGGASLNKRTADQFASQMQQLKKLPELRSKPELMHDAILVEEGKSPIYWVVLADRRSIVWKQFSPEPEKSGGASCPSIPMGDDDDSTNFNDICLGKVYGIDGRQE
jgi:hypothetical protein